MSGISERELQRLARQLGETASLYASFGLDDRDWSAAARLEEQAAQIQTLARLQETRGVTAALDSARAMATRWEEQQAYTQVAERYQDLLGIGPVHESALIAQIRREHESAHKEAMARLQAMVDAPIVALRQQAFGSLYPNAHTIDRLMADEAERYREAREQMLGLSGLVGRSMDTFLSDLRDTDRMTDYLAEHFGKVFPDYSDSIRGFLGDVNFEALRGVALDASDGIADEWDDDEPTDIQDIDDAVARVDLDAIRDVVQQAMERALAQSDARGFRLVMVTIIVTIMACFIQPLFERWLESLPPSPDERPNPRSNDQRAVAVVMVSLRPVELRLGPHSTQQRMAQVAQGALLRVVGARHGWYRVTTVALQGDGASMTGWVRANHLRRVEDETLRRVMCAVTVPREDGECSE